MQLIAVLIVIALLLMIGVAIPYVIGAAITIAYIICDNAAFLEALPKRIFTQVDLFALMAMPLFILVGEIMNKGGITDALVRASQVIVGRFKGGLGYTNIMTSVFFAGISGAAMADAAALSNTLVPAMKKQGYSTRYAAAITAASSIIGPILPPSIILIFYGAIMGVDVSALFVAGIIPGLLLAGVLGIANGIFAMRENHPGGSRTDIPPVFKTLKHSAPALLLPIIIIFGIIFGLMTPTEAAAVAVIAAFFVSYKYGRMDYKMLYDSFRRTIILSGAIFIMFGTASAVSFLATLSLIPQNLAGWIATIGVSGDAFLIILMGVFLVLGMFTETQIALILVTPLLVPIALAQGADPVHMGIIVCLNLSMGLISPPLGGVLLVTSTITGVKYWTLVRSVLPFLLAEITLLIILVLFPDLTLYLPRTLEMIK